MLFSLHIHNIALIDDMEIEFCDGLNILTGETGAGKSILIHAINLLLGERANRELIRHGADEAEVSGVFYVTDDSLSSLLAEQGTQPEEDGSVILSRRLLLDGKNICRINGRAVSLSELKSVGSCLVNIHGQHDNQALLNPSMHIHFLDSFLKDEGKVSLSAYREAYSQWRSLVRELESMETDEGERLRKIDLLTYEIDEIRKAALSSEEEEDLKKKREIINHKKHLEKSLALALSALSDSPQGEDARQGIGIAAQALSEASDLDDALSPLADKLQILGEEIDEITRSLRSYFDGLAEDDMPIDDIEARLDEIYRLKRKYGETIQKVLIHLEENETELSALENAESRKDEIEALIIKTKEAVDKRAKQLSELRLAAIGSVSASINETLHFLNMEEADFKIELTPAPLHPYGAETVSFSLKTNAGEAYRPLEKIISGGELSRTMLAIKSVLTDGDGVDTLIFDEIDTGVSGSAAQKIGFKLRDLSIKKQVLCVTHLPQIAAMAKTHYLISKSAENGRTKTAVRPLAYEDRLKALAQLIGGDTITETTLKQAEEMIDFGNKDYPKAN